MSHIYLDREQQIIVDLGEAGVAVSWPGGFKVLSYEDSVHVLLGTVRLAVDDVLAARPTKRELREQRTKFYNEGFDAGWDAYKERVEGHTRRSRGRAMRESHPSTQQQGQTGLVTDAGQVAL